jgi:hypothetical protein
MVSIEIAQARLYNQHLEGEKPNTPAGVIASLGAVQAQEYALAKCALGLRIAGATDDLIENAFNEGQVLRTHLMRPTWHFVTPEDIGWLLQLTVPRVHQVNGTIYRKLELDEKLLRRSTNLIAAAVEGGKHLTRAELGAVLIQQGIDATDGMRLGYILHYAELEGIVCSGARRGKQHTYALIAERAPHAKQLSREEALAELTLRFFTSHGPATVKDFSWWSGLTIADVKRGLAMLPSQLTHESIDGEIYWFAVSQPPTRTSSDNSYLLPVYDEYTVGYKQHSAILDPQYAPKVTDRFFTSAFVYKGEIIGMWRRTFSKQSVVVELMRFRTFTSAEQESFVAAAQRFGEFLEMQVVLPD